MRPDPFALPSATGARFALLMLSTVVGSVLVYLWPAGMAGGRFRGPLAVDRVGCVNDARRGVLAVDGTALTERFGDCVDQAYLSAVGRIALMVALLLAVAVAAYLAAPWLVRRRGPVVPLDALGGAPADRVREVLAEAGQPVHVDVAALGSATGARAYGRLGRYRLLLDAGLLARGARDPRALRGVLFHELAHVRNRDIDITYLTLALWWAFLLAAALPALLYAAVEPKMITEVWWRVGLFLLVLWLARTAVLRSREYYADARAAAANGDPDSLEAALADRPRRWWRLLSNHPDGPDRVAALRGEPVLFRVGAGEALGAGLLLGYAYPLLSFLLSNLMPGTAFVRDWVVGLVLGACAAAALAGSAWRAVQHALAEQADRAPATWRAALALTAGVLAGQVAVPAMPDVGSWAMIAGAEPLFGAVTALALLVLCQVYLRWVVLSAYTRLRGTPRPGRSAAFGVTASAAVFGLWASTWFMALAMLSSSYPTWQTLGIGVGAAVLNPVLAACVAWGCLYPLTGLLRTTRGTWRAWLTGVALIVAGFPAAMLPLHPYLTGLLRDGRWWTAFLVLGAASAAVTAACGLLLGLWRGGRRRVGEAAVLAGAAALTAAPVLVVEQLAHLAVLGCPAGAMPQCLSRMPVPQTTGLGGAILAIASVTTALAALCAAAGARAVHRRTRTDEPFRRHPALVATALLPALLSVAALVWTGTGTFVASTDSYTELNDAQVAELDRYAAAIRPGSITRPTACAYSSNLSYGVDLTELNTVWLSRLSTGAVTAASSDDVVLRALGGEAMRALYAMDLPRNNRANRAIGNYCVIVAAAELVYETRRGKPAAS
ncbi:M48 family metalloprotease [Catellatospora sichuanensis]|uniref:M48 family metalloprotease n=1 Tax=Catellatospora sichuanensis TaxID=1969805 RepID=UPI001FE2F729|nr:M48 family metalloprotease [Catellatospora sichuanensis]